MRLTDQVHGVYPIAPTAFLEDGSIDTASMDRLTDFYVSCGATGVTVLGQLGEAP
ncbi:MAG: dihydrodipicolinate synthase family protein, partial [Betaproteobacteria bacterium]|nr:dihydrodipicolinate synthase family protein [Betaproteobacteria bacterium]